MGMWSRDCKGCGHPLLLHAVTNRINGWMSDAVVIKRDGHICTGFFDGYGGVDGDYDDESLDYVPALAGGWKEDGESDGTAPTVWHRACWVVSGSPTNYQGESEYSDDQGYFFEDPDHDMPEPHTPIDLEIGRDVMNTIREERYEEGQLEIAEYEALKDVCIKCGESIAACPVKVQAGFRYRHCGICNDIATEAECLEEQR